jgi:hypothetical protein
MDCSVTAGADERSMGPQGWLIGCEGMAEHSGRARRRHDIASLHGSNPTAAWRMTAHDLRFAMRESPALAGTLLRYVHTTLVQAVQSGVCNSQHSLDQRWRVCFSWRRIASPTTISG